MMRLNKLPHFLFLLIICAFTSGCTDLENKDILGRWSVKYVKLVAANLDADLEADLQAELESMVFYFKDDGLLLYSNFYRSGAHGQWKLTPEKDILTCTYQYERATYSDKYKVTQEGESLLLVSSDFDGVSEVQITLIRSTQ